MAHLKQVLTIPIPEGVMDHLHYSPVTVLSAPLGPTQSGYMGGAAEVVSDLGGVMGVLVYYPAISLKALVSS